MAMVSSREWRGVMRKGSITDPTHLCSADQLKSVMEQVLNFAVRELTKIVEASFDDLLLEITKMEKEHKVLEERMGRSNDRGGGDKGKGGGGRRRGSENDSVSPSGSEDTREELAEESKDTAPTGDPKQTPILSVTQDWVPILDKVFGQKWCSDVWQINKPSEGGGSSSSSGGGGGSGRSLNEGGVHHSDLVSAPSMIMQPSPSSPQQDPRWTPLEDMEVFSPDNDDAANVQSNATVLPPGPSPGPPTSPSGERTDTNTCSNARTHVTGKRF
uniref:Uncharacterized protein n=2 Tax=Nothobranchius furzeri TaxID=105023 RepID=A0A8C6MF38_NOTFU